MYDGKEETVTLICKNNMMNNIIDKFGGEVKTSPTDFGHFKTVVRVYVNRTFFAWVFQFSGDIKIAHPLSVAIKYKEMLVNALNKSYS